MTQIDTDSKAVILRALKLVMIWIPIIVGLIYQFLLYRDTVGSIYVILDPPGYIPPFASLEFEWWFILSILTSILTILTRSNRIRPHRLVYPFYIYLIYLLTLVKPV